MLEITLQDGRKLVFSYNFVTIASRRKIVLEQKKRKAPVVEKDETILEELHKKYSEKPPSYEEIYEGALRLLNKGVDEEPDDDLYFSDAINRYALRWADEAGNLKELTQEEYDDLPYDLILDIASKLDKEEKGFLVVKREQN